MANSYTGDINTEGDFETLASETGMSFTNGKTYTIQVEGQAYLKMTNAEFRLKDTIIPFACVDTPYIKTDDLTHVVILENA